IAHPRQEKEKRPGNRYDAEPGQIRVESPALPATGAHPGGLCRERNDDAQTFCAQSEGYRQHLGEQYFYPLQDAFAYSASLLPELWRCELREEATARAAKHSLLEAPALLRARHEHSYHPGPTN